MDNTSDDYFKSVLAIFRKHYIKIPLEVFKSHPYKTLISTLLSSRTRDEVTLEAAKRLFKKAPNIKRLQQLDNLTIQQLIFPVGFYKTKAKHLELLADKVLNDFKGKIPVNRESLMKLPGVGRKTANLVLNRAFKIPAIAVDTHVHRISNLLGWVKTTTPEKTEIELMKILPEKYWSEINRLLVSLGRRFSSKKKLEVFLKLNNLSKKR